MKCGSTFFASKSNSVHCNSIMFELFTIKYKSSSPTNMGLTCDSTHCCRVESLRFKTCNRDDWKLRTSWMSIYTSTLIPNEFETWMHLSARTRSKSSRKAAMIWRSHGSCLWGTALRQTPRFQWGRKERLFLNQIPMYALMVFQVVPISMLDTLVECGPSLHSNLLSSKDDK